MFWKSSLLLVAAGLHSMSAVALPTLVARDDTQCAPGTTFYVCELNNFQGCCSIDPCALTTGCPDKSNSCGPNEGENRVYNPGMRIVGKDGPQPNDFHVSKSNDSIQEQTMYFSIPAEAKDCSLRWGVPAADERDFKVEGNGLVDLHLVDEEDNVGEKIGGADFTYWDDDETAQDAHLAGAFECKAEPKFRVTPVNNGDIFIDQNDHTGWYIQYNC